MVNKFSFEVSKSQDVYSLNMLMFSVLYQIR